MNDERTAVGTKMLIIIVHCFLIQLYITSNTVSVNHPHYFHSFNWSLSFLSLCFKVLITQKYFESLEVWTTEEIKTALHGV